MTCRRRRHPVVSHADVIALPALLQLQVVARAAASLPDALKVCCITAVLQAAGSHAHLAQGMPALPAAAAVLLIEEVVRSISSSPSATAACSRGLMHSSEQEQQQQQPASAAAQLVMGLLCCCSSADVSIPLSSSELADAAAAVAAVQQSVICRTASPMQECAALSGADDLQGLVAQVAGMSLSAAAAAPAAGSSSSSSSTAGSAGSRSQGKRQAQQPEQQQQAEQQQQPPPQQVADELLVEVSIWCLKQLVDCAPTGERLLDADAEPSLLVVSKLLSCLEQLQHQLRVTAVGDAAW